MTGAEIWFLIVAVLITCIDLLLLWIVTDLHKRVTRLEGGPLRPQPGYEKLGGYPSREAPKQLPKVDSGPSAGASA